MISGGMKLLEEQQLAKQKKDRKLFAEHTYFREMNRIAELAQIAVNDNIRNSAWKVNAAVNEIFTSEKDNDDFDVDILTQHLINANNALLYPCEVTLHKLITDAANLPGKPSLGWKILGGLLAGLGAAIAAFGGVVLAVGLGVTATGIGFAPGVATSVFGGGLIAGGLALAGCGAGLFHSGRQSGSYKTIQDLHDSLKDFEGRAVVNLDKTSEADCVEDLVRELKKATIQYHNNDAHLNYYYEISNYCYLITQIKLNTEFHPTKKLVLVLLVSMFFKDAVNDNFKKIINDKIKDNGMYEILTSFDWDNQIKNHFSHSSNDIALLDNLRDYYEKHINPYTHPELKNSKGKSVRDIVNDYVDSWNPKEENRLKLMTLSEKEISKTTGLNYNYKNL